MSANVPSPYDPPLSERWLAGYAKRRRLAKRIANVPGAYSLVAALAKLFMHIGRFGALVRMVHRDVGQEFSVREHDKNKAGNPVDYGSGYGFDSEADDFSYLELMQTDLRAGARSKHLPTFQRGFNEISRLIHTLEIERVVNFGVALAWMDDRLAELYPNVEFVGIDRALSIKAFNDEAYHRPNLSFVAADVNDWLAKQGSLKGHLCVNMRTMLNFPEGFVRAYYRNIYGRGAAGVYCLEDYGIPRETDKIYPLDFERKPSVHYRNRIMMHNYPEIIASAGFTVTRVEFFENWWQDEDQRYVELSATR